MIPWAALGVTIALAAGVDLAAHRGDRVDSPRRALAWSGLWIGVALLFGGWVFLALGAPAGEEFFGAYFLEKSLSADNMLIFLLIFSRLGIPLADQRRVLFWGIAGALVTRGVFIAAGIAFVNRWHFVLYGFGALLVITAVRLASSREQPEEPRVATWVRQRLPIAHRLVGHRFTTVEHGRRLATPLLLALIVVEITDVLFALDSIPAAFSVTRDPFVLYASNVLAVLGLRALFMVLASLLEGVRFLRFGVAAILAFAGGKMLLARWIHIGVLSSLAVIAACLAATLISSAMAARRRARRRAT